MDECVAGKMTARDRSVLKRFGGRSYFCDVKLINEVT